MYQMISYKVENNVATITLNRPEVGNAFAFESYQEVKGALENAGSDEQVRVVVITGTGKNFSAGGDIKRFKMLIDTQQYLPPDGVLAAGEMARAVRECPKPVIAMVNGAAAGAGASLALACDFRVLEESSKIVMAFINMGFSGDTCGSYHLAKMVGIAKTTELMALGTLIRAKDAYNLGLANRLAEDGQLQEVTDQLSQELLGKPTQAIARQKKLYNEFFFNEIQAYAKREAQYMVECGKTADHSEAVHAFLEKRKPSFSGK